MIFHVASDAGPEEVGTSASFPPLPLPRPRLDAPPRPSFPRPLPDSDGADGPGPSFFTCFQSPEALPSSLEIASVISMAHLESQASIPFSTRYLVHFAPRILFACAIHLLLLLANLLLFDSFRFLRLFERVFVCDDVLQAC
jgi:hypothetical protein